MMDKKKLRKEVLARRSALSEQEQKEKSTEIARKVILLDEFKKYKTILLYEAFRNEVQTDKIYREARTLGKQVYYPRINAKEMEFYRVDDRAEFEVGAYGIREPKPEDAKRYLPKEDDEMLVVVPGVAFDEKGNRIGYGGGYYDKYLQRLADGNLHKNICMVAVAYDFQIVEPGMIERETHDIRMDSIITETRDIRRET